MNQISVERIQKAAREMRGKVKGNITMKMLWKAHFSNDCCLNTFRDLMNELGLKTSLDLRRGKSYRKRLPRSYVPPLRPNRPEALVAVPWLLRRLAFRRLGLDLT